MAEGGNEDKDNPYSYQHFLKPSSGDEYLFSQASSKKKCDVTSDSNNTNNNFLEEPDIGIPTRRDVNKLIVAEEEKTIKREENPFSLKQFLKKDLGAKRKHNTARSEICEVNGVGYNPTVDREGLVESTSKLPNFASGLPDFVQDHFYVDHSLRDLGTIYTSGKNEDKFSELLSNSSVETNPNESCTLDSPKKIKARNSPRNGGVLGDNNIVSSSLPDFLSDGPMLNNHIDHHYQSQSETSPIQFQQGSLVHNLEQADEIAMLKTENEQLKQQLQQTNQVITNKICLIQQLQEEVTLLKAKENEETNALEKIVHQIENNLQSTMKRAVTAESLVVKLKQEIKMLQSKLNGMSTQNDTLHLEDKQLTNMREKANTASHQIEMAASNAEQTIRQLLTGVESLKFIASYLHNIDKITDTDQADST